MKKVEQIKVDIDFVRKWAEILENTYDSFGMRTKVAEVNNLGTEIEYRLRIAEGTKLTHFKAREDDIALAMASPTGHVKVVAPIPGTQLVGVTIPIPKPQQTKKKKSYEIITVTKTIKVSEYSMAELLRDGTTGLFNAISKYSGVIAERVNKIGRMDHDDTNIS
jgi:DNA segregation ATPase FtsK/SpoIIIE-like protein